MSHQVLQAYVRPQLAARVIQSLIDAGCPDLLFEEGGRIAHGSLELPDGDAKYSVQVGQTVEPMIRLEAVGRREEVERWVRVIRESGTTHRHGDGIVMVLPLVEHFHLSGPPDSPGHRDAGGGRVA